MKKGMLLIILSVFVMGLAFSCTTKGDDWDMKGVVLSVNDLKTLNWAELAAENGINTIGTHMFPGEVLDYMKTEQGQAFLKECKEKGIHVEHQVHAMGELLPRDLFDEDPSMFRMDENGNRVSDFNCCVHSQKALDVIAKNAVEVAKILTPTNHRYYFWLDDNKPTCECPQCSQLSPSEQALVIENSIIKALRTIDPEAMLAHLAYDNTLSAPTKVKPEPGIFLEFAPIWRTWSKPLTDLSAMPFVGKAIQMSHADNLRFLEDNLKVFPAETAVVLEYWLDVSLFSDWTKPAVKLPWNREIFESDLKTYASYGIKNVTSFAVYMDSTYFNAYPDKSYLKEYGEGFSRVPLKK